MKTRLLKYVGISISSIIAVSGVIYAASNITTFSQTVIGGDTISEQWYSLVNSSLSKIFDDTGNLKDGSIPANKIGRIPADQIDGLPAATTPVVADPNYEYMLVPPSTNNTIACYYKPTNQIVADSFCAKDLLGGEHSSQECGLLGGSVEFNADGKICVFNEIPSGSTTLAYYYGPTINVNSVVNGYRRDAAGYYYSSASCKLYTKQMDPYSTAVSAYFKYAGKSGTLPTKIAASNTSTSCTTGSHPYGVYESANSSIPNLKYSVYSASVTTYYSVTMYYFDDRIKFGWFYGTSVSPIDLSTKLSSEYCLRTSAAGEYNIPPSTIDNVAGNLLGAAYRQSIACK
ncbi:MAG: hypothetical protein PHS92_00110 [Candidatus Gracilibacteria bacterium]|nr:hypothetical protein [Candidatus Gracilibacteria bacterium]